MAAGKKTVKKAQKAKTSTPPKRKPAPAPKKVVKPAKAKPKPAPRPAKKAPPPKPKKAVAPPKPAKPAPAPKPAPPPRPAAPAKAPPAPKPAPAPVTPAPASKGKKKPIPTTSLAATPVIRPLTAERVEHAPPPPPAKPGHVDHQVLSAVTYGLFAAVNKTFGFAGQSVVKNAALRMLEYGYKRGWLPPKAKEPIRALNEFFGRLETMGYAERIHIGKRGDQHVLEVVGLADFDAVHSLREMHYPLLPVFLGEMLQAIVDQYFSLKVTLQPIEMQDQRRGFSVPFMLHEKVSAGPEVARMLPYARQEEMEE